MICKRTVKKFCCEDISMIENYDKAINDKTQTWICHHRLGLGRSHKELQRLGIYENRPAAELIFLTPSEHQKLHKIGVGNPRYGKPGTMKGKHQSEEARKKMSESLKGEKHPMYGKPGTMKGKTHSDETKRKISEASKNKSDEYRHKMSAALKAAWAKRKAKACNK